MRSTSKNLKKKSKYGYIPKQTANKFDPSRWYSIKILEGIE